MLPKIVPIRVNKVDLTDAEDINSVMENCQYLDDNKSDKIITLAVDHASSGTIRFCPYGETIKFGDFLYQHANGKMFKASAADSAKMPAVGIALAEGVADTLNEVLFDGMVRIDTLNLTVGANIYVSSTTAGGLTQTAPISPDQAQIVGRAVASNTILFAPQFINTTIIGDRITTLESYFTQPSVAKKSMTHQSVIYASTEDFLTYAVKQRVSRFNPGHTNAPNATDWFTVEWITAAPDDGITKGHLIARSETTYTSYLNTGLADGTFAGWKKQTNSDGLITYADKSDRLKYTSYSTGDFKTILEGLITSSGGSGFYIIGCDQVITGLPAEFTVAGTTLICELNIVSTNHVFIRAMCNATYQSWIGKYNTGTITWTQLTDAAGNAINANTVAGKTVGNASGNVPLSNGTLNTDLNADMIDSKHWADIINALYPVGSAYTQYYGLPTPSTLWGGTWALMYNTSAVCFMTESAGGATYEAETFDGVVYDSQKQGHWHQNYVTGAAAVTTTGGSYGLTASGGPVITNLVMTKEAITDGTNGTPRTGKATKPRRVIVRVWQRTA